MEKNRSQVAGHLPVADCQKSGVREYRMSNKDLRISKFDDTS